MKREMHTSVQSGLNIALSMVLMNTDNTDRGKEGKVLIYAGFVDQTDYFSVLVNT